MTKEEPKKLADLEQKPLPWRRHVLTLYEDRFELSVRGWLDRYRIPFYLHNVKDVPDRVIVVSWLWLAFAVAALLGASFLFIYSRNLGETLLSFGLDAIGMTVLAIQFLKMRPRLVYTYKTSSPDHTGGRYEPHLYIVPDQPSPEAVRKFIDLATVTQKRHIEKMKAEQEGEAGIAYARELERFADLRAKEALSEEEFAQVKAKLLNLKPRRMGFRP